MFTLMYKSKPLQLQGPRLQPPTPSGQPPIAEDECGSTTRTTTHTHAVALPPWLVVTVASFLLLSDLPLGRANYARSLHEPPRPAFQTPRFIMAESGSLQWTILLVLTALLLSAVVLAQVATVYTTAYLAAPQEITTFVDTADFSIQENESYDRDVARVQRLEDKIRLGQLLREIQKGGDDLREDLNGILIEEGSTKLRASARVLWASKRSQLEDRVRRLDLLRMRFLVVYMGIIASNTNEKPPPPVPKDPEKTSLFETPNRPMLPKGFVDSINRRPPLRRLTTQAIGHQESVSHSQPHRKGWAGVVQELQKSPRMHQRHASIEQSMSRTSKTP
ncbi:hypothetical protein G7046_g1076 [Stylonectria norvegica]|nr:hypothetical protein G7046_g1076 [Stylonectria norvegica]